MPILHGIHYHEHGERRAGTALVLIHGAASSSLGFLDWSRRLGHERRTIAFDLPGHGRSEPPANQAPEALIAAYRDATGALCAALGISRAILIGHSMGGAVALHCARSYPDKVAGLVLVATGARLTVNAAIPVVLRSEPQKFPALVAASGYSPDTPQGVVRRWTEGLPACDRELAARDFEACAAYDARPWLGELSAPCLIVHGKDDLLVPPHRARELEAIPGARMVVLPRAGHFPFHEQEDAVASAILDFLS